MSPPSGTGQQPASNKCSETPKSTNILWEPEINSEFDKELLVTFAKLAVRSLTSSRLEELSNFLNTHPKVHLADHVDLLMGVLADQIHNALGPLVVNQDQISRRASQQPPICTHGPGKEAKVDESVSSQTSEFEKSLAKYEELALRALQTPSTHKANHSTTCAQPIVLSNPVQQMPSSSHLKPPHCSPLKSFSSREHFLTPLNSKEKQDDLSKSHMIRRPISAASADSVDQERSKRSPLLDMREKRENRLAQNRQYRSRVLTYSW